MFDFCYLQERWLPTLRNLVAQINETFSKNFQEMAVAGEVLLGILLYFTTRAFNTFICSTILIRFLWLDEHGNDFDSFGILIKVKFR